MCANCSSVCNQEKVTAAPLCGPSPSGGGGFLDAHQATELPPVTTSSLRRWGDCGAISHIAAFVHPQVSARHRLASDDHLGNVRMLTDGSGNVVARQDYLPFGEEIPAGYAGRSASLLFGASDGVEQKFTGQIRDSETGMDFFTARYYGSALGRFTSPDPMNLGADLLDPQSWNAYAYVRNNPLALVDPMGLCTFDAEGNAVEDA